jgi:hypothetical protein
VTPGGWRIGYQRLRPWPQRPVAGMFGGCARGRVAAAAYPVGEVKRRSIVGLRAKENAATGAAFFVSYPLLSEYQVQPEIRPNIFEGIRM